MPALILVVFFVVFCWGNGSLKHILDSISTFLRELEDEWTHHDDDKGGE